MLKNYKILLLSIILLLAGCSVTAKNKYSDDCDTVNINIKCVGDIMIHSPQISSALKEDGSYNFDENYIYVKPYIESADLAICNLETTFGGKPYAGYPKFSAPDELANTLKNTGFDIAVTANNHMYDTGIEGLKRTLNILNEAALLTVGSASKENEKKYVIINIKGIKIAIFAFTYETSKFNNQKTINGILIDKDAEHLINSFNLDNIDLFLNECYLGIESAKKDGAGIIVFYLHWGTEYKDHPDEYQKDLAKTLALNGADIIFGSHPHVIQKYEIITDTKNNRQIPVYYSLGNFISNQREEFSKNRKTEDGIIAVVDLVFDKKLKRIAKINADYIPTWTNKYNNGIRNIYNIIPLTGTFETTESIKNSGNEIKATEALANITSALTLE